MTKLVPLKLLSTLSSRSEVGDILKLPGDGALVVRGIPRLLIFKCPCGCGDEVPVNLDARAGKAWRLFIREKDKKLSLFPSVWRDTGCKSHFIIWNDNILLFDERYYDEYSEEIRAADMMAVENSLPHGHYVHFLEVADQLGQVPWYTLDICKMLVRQGKAAESKDRGNFKKANKRR